MRFPPNQLLLYKLFLSNPSRAFYMQEIGRILNKKPGVFQRTLNNLEVDGFVVSEFKANARFFRLNTDYIVLDEISSILKKLEPKLDIFKDRISELDRLQNLREEKKRIESSKYNPNKKDLSKTSDNNKKTPPPSAKKSIRLEIPEPVSRLSDLKKDNTESDNLPNKSKNEIKSDVKKEKNKRKKRVLVAPKKENLEQPTEKKSKQKAPNNQTDKITKKKNKTKDPIDQLELF